MSTIVPPPSALNNIVPFKPVAPIPPITAPTPIGAVIAAGAITAALVTAAAIAYSDMRSAEESAKRAKENTEKALARLNTGKQDLFAPPPFQGGQCQGVQYVVSGRDIVTNATGLSWTATVPGRISAPSTLITSGGFVSHGFYYGNQTANNFYSRGGANWYGVGKDVVGITITSVTPQGGLADNCGSLSTPKLGETTPNLNGLGTGSSKSNNLLAPSPTSSTSARPISTPTSINNSTTANTFNSTTNKNKNLAPDPGNITNSLNIGSAIGLGSPAIAPNPSPIKTPTPISTPPSTKPKKEEERKPFLPPIPSELGKINADIVSLNSQIAGIGAILGTISANTAPEAQRLNSKNGTCDAMQSPSCTQGMEGRIKDPINAKLDAAQVARDVNASAQSAALTSIVAEQQAQKGILATIAAKATDIFNLVGGLWNNGIVDKAMQYITMITVIHNAAMLTRGIADTLGSALDLGLQAFGLQIKDKDGNQLGVNQVIGKSFENLIKGIIGADNYTALTQTWVQANRIYQTGINLISNVQNILDSTTAVAELTSNRVGTLMNALRNAGMVRENAYGAQSQNVTRFNAFQNKLEALEQGVSNTASIAGNIVSVQQSVNEIKSNRQEFENALKNKPQGSGLPENEPEKQATKQKKDQSIYTISDFSIVKPPETP